MKAVFLKEWRQAYLSLWLGLVLAAFIPVLCLVILLTRDPTYPLQRDMNYLVGGFFFLYPFGIAVIAGANAFAPEIERGTLPLLLSLPLSRRRIWLSKLLATFTIGLTTFSLTFVPNYFILPLAFEQVDYGLYAPDVAIWSFITFLCAFLLSTLVRRTVSAILGGLLLAAALCVVILVFVAAGGAMLLGYDPVIDAALWAIILAPGLLTASYLAFTRGGLLMSGRKWTLAFAGFAVTALITVLPTIGVTKWLVRYHRESLAKVDVGSISHDGSIAVIDTQAFPVRLARRSDRGWFERRHNAVTYRSSHSVCVDTATGRELLVRPLTRRGAPSPHGRYVAFAFGVRQLTWFEESGEPHSRGEPRSLEVWDLRSRRLLYRGLPDVVWQEGLRLIAPVHMPLEWSPDGARLAAWSRRRTSRKVVVPGDAPDSWWTAVIMRRDGSEARAIDCPEYEGLSGAHTWGRGANANGFYTIQPRLRLMRHDLAAGHEKLLWDGAAEGYLPKGRYASGVHLSSSPDGEWLAVAFVTRARLRRRDDKAVLHLMLAAADGSRPRLLYEGAYPDYTSRAYPVTLRSPVWSEDGRSLYLRFYYRAVGERHARSGGILRWDGGKESASEVALPDELRNARVYSVPHSDDVLLLSHESAGYLRPDGSYRPLPEPVEKALIDSGYVKGFDGAGRALITRSEGKPRVGETWKYYLAACDLRTGQVERIYP